MKYLVILLAAVSVYACDFEGPGITYPKGATLCNKDPDCLEGQYCGFVPGYTAATCRGTARSLEKNLN